MDTGRVLHLDRVQAGDAVRANAGGWHDAGDFDLRVESLSGESTYRRWLMSFNVSYDVTTIDQKRK